MTNRKKPLLMLSEIMEMDGSAVIDRSAREVSVRCDAGNSIKRFRVQYSQAE